MSDMSLGSKKDTFPLS
uniref:Uncharacterized protein n=1 Tax=Anguilla anguilla TaxID=7936 RepID=A0A0E9XTK7_ANGAN